MSLLVLAIITAATISLIQLTIYCYLYFSEKKEYLAIWTLSWAVYFFRFLFDLSPKSWGLIGSQLMLIVSGFLLLIGTYLFLNQRVPKLWFLFATFLGIWVPLAINLGIPFQLSTIFSFLFVGLINVWTGLVFITTKEIQGIGKYLTGWAFIVWGLHKFDYPFFSQNSLFAPWGYIAGSLLGLFVALGMILIYFEKFKNELKQSEEYFRLLYQNIPLGYQSLDSNGNFIDVNQIWLNTLGYSRGEVIGKWFGDFIDETSLAKYTTNFPRFKETGMVQDIELNMIRKDGSPITVTFNGRIAYEKSGAVKQTYCLFQDITKRKQEAEELQKAKNIAETANRTKSQFLANISHEIRTPMNEIIGMTDLLLETKLTATQQEYLDIVKGSSESLLEIINDILDLAKIEAGKFVLEKTEFNVTDIIKKVLKMFAIRAQKKGLEFISNFQPNIPKAILGDPGRLQQIFINLIGNAIKFTNQGYVKVNVEMVNETEAEVELKFFVIDTGIGINPDKIKLLFQNYSQMDGSFSRKYGGSGLGLAITKQLVEIMGGNIGINSQEDQGSEFWFTIRFPKPIHRDTDLPQTEKVQFVHSQIDRAKLPAKILLVEDNLVNQKLLAVILERRGWEVAKASDGVTALKMLEGAKYDLVLMDMQMPKMDGFETTIHLRRMEKLTQTYTPIIALTAYAMAGDRERCLAAGMDEYLAKPIKAEKLYETVERFLIPKQKPVNMNPTLPTVDLTVIMENANRDLELVREIISLFLTDYPSRIQELKSALQEEDYRKFELTAHSFRGAIANFGAGRAMELLDNLEQHGKNHYFIETPVALRNLEAEMAEIEKYLKNALKKFNSLR